MSKQEQFELYSLDRLTTDLEQRLNDNPPTGLLQRVGLRTLLQGTKYKAGGVIKALLTRTYAAHEKEIHKFLKVLMNIKSKKLDDTHYEKFETLLLDMALDMCINRGLSPKHGSYLFSRAAVIQDMLHDLFLYADLQSFKQNKFYAFTSIRDRLASNYTNSIVNRLLVKHIKEHEDVETFSNNLIDFLKAAASLLISTITTYTNYFEYTVVDSKKQLRLSQSALKVIEKDRTYKIQSIRYSMPFVEEPIDWVWSDDKGVVGLYRSPALLTTSSILNTRSYMLAQGEEGFRPYIEFANKMNKQKWKINYTIVNILRQIVEDVEFMDNNTSTLFGIADLQVVDPDDTSHVKVHKINSNKKRLAKLVSLHGSLEDISVLEKYMDEYIYFGYRMDNRGRMYPVSRYLSPQGTGFVKAMLMFGSPCTLTEEGVENVKQYLAKLFGHEKMTKQARLEQFEGIADQIAEVGYAVNSGLVSIPHKELWAGTDAMMCLAAASEWVKIYHNPVGAEWYLPVTIDGTCNGIQHIAAITRDAELASYVNVIDAYGDVPADIYGMCIDIAKQELRDRASAGDKVAAYWLNYELTRKLSKSAVMVTPYNASNGTKAGNITKAMSIEIPDFKDIPRDTRVYLRDVILAATLKVTKSAVDNYSAAIRSSTVQYVDTSSGYTVTHIYTTPLGLKVYPKIKTITNSKQFTMFGKIYTIAYSDFTLPLNKGSLANQTCPNVIHSYDSSHMIMSMNELLTQHPDANVWLIHDEFGTDPNHLNTLQHIIRDKFVELHDNYPLESIMAKPLTVEYKVGSLNLEDVKKSKFLFN
jgi:DNA-directed RNA polymerase